MNIASVSNSGHFAGESKPLQYISNRTLFAFVLLFGLYCPTSIDGSTSRLLFAIAFFTSATLLAVVACRTGLDGKTFLWISAPIVLWLVACTLISVFSLYHFNISPLGLFGLLGFIYSINLRRLKCPNLKPLLIITSIINLALGISMLLIDRVSEFMISNYNNFDDLVSGLIEVHKPVTVFSTHSIAGTFTYLFFFLNFRTYKKTGKNLYLWLAILNVLMCLALVSTTSLAFSALAVAELAYTFKWQALTVVVGMVCSVPSGVKEFVGEVLSQATLPGDGNGLGARFGDSGTLSDSISYITNHPFLPMGLNYAEIGNFRDSGPIECMVRGSVPLVMLVYGGLFWFLYRNLNDRRDCYRLFLVMMAAEVGISTLIYSRSFLLLPAFVIYLNSLTESGMAPVSQQIWAV